MLARQEGFTLLETLVAVSLFVTLFVSVGSVLYIGQTSLPRISRWTDQSQQLRLAMSSMSEDLTYAELNSPTPCTTDASGTTCVFDVYQPVTQNPDGEWPGDLMDWPPLIVEYRLGVDGTLSRRVREGANSNYAYTWQVLANGLDPTSTLQVDSTQKLVKARLKASLAGVATVAHLYSEFHLR